MHKIINIRALKKSEKTVLDDLLYQAVFQKPNEEPVPEDIIYSPDIYVYVKDFGKKDDLCLVAEFENKIAGAVWVRILNGEVKGCANIDDSTPEFAISLFPQYRNRGIGTFLMNKMIALLKAKGYKKTSLSVNKENYAVRMYKFLGFKIIEEREDDYLMVLNLE